MFSLFFDFIKEVRKEAKKEVDTVKTMNVNLAEEISKNMEEID